MGSKANRPTFDAIAYDELVPRLRTGDVVVFHGVSFASRAIERVTGSRYSHAAMIYRPELDEPPMLWETTSLPGEIHNDPADRIIIATALTLGAELVTKDEKLLRYPHVITLW